MVVTRYKQSTMVERMARFSHYRFRCEDCGQIHNLTRADRLNHYITCRLYRNLLFNMKTGCSFLKALVTKKQTKEQNI